MERKCQHLQSSQVREFNNVNYRQGINQNGGKNFLASSYVHHTINSTFDNSTRKSRSKNKDLIKGLNNYDKNSSFYNSPLKSQYGIENSKPIQSSTFRPKSNYNNDDDKYITKGSQFQKYLNISEENKQNYVRQSRASCQLNIQIKNVARQSRINSILQNGESKEKFKFRDTLGSLSKQIKTALKPINTPYQQKILKQSQSLVQMNRFNLSSSKVTENVVSDEPYKRYQKSSSFLLMNSNAKLNKPKKLQLNLNDSKINLATTYREQKSTRNKHERTKSQVSESPLIPIRAGRTSTTTGLSNFNKLNNDKDLKQSGVRVNESLNASKVNKKTSHSFTIQNDKNPVQTSFTSKRSTFYNTSTCYNLKSNAKLNEKESRSNSNFLGLSSVKGVNESFSKGFNQTGSSFSSSTNYTYLTKQRDSMGSQGPRNSLDSNDSKKGICLEDFRLGSVKGQGRFGKFYPAIHKKTGMLFGIKQIKKESLKYMLDQFIQQLKIQSFVDHPNIVKLYGYFATKQHFYIILQYMEEGSLFSFIKKNRKIQQTETACKMKQICSAVQYLHNNEILHRDIKPENIVMTCDVCKLCDFGWSVYSSARRKTYCGTLDYVCPEILQGQQYDSNVDIWAIGVLAYEMVVGKAPFYNISRKQTMKKIMECDFEIPKQLSEKSKRFITKALKKNPNERYTICMLVKDDFVN